MLRAGLVLGVSEAKFYCFYLTDKKIETWRFLCKLHAL